MRCRRCAGAGDISIITDELWIHPDVRPRLQFCPDCNGTGYAPLETALALEEATPDDEPPRRRLRR